MKRSLELALWSWAFTGLVVIGFCAGTRPAWVAAAFVCSVVTRVGSMILREMGR